MLGRDVERTEHLARLLRVHLDLSLDPPARARRRFWSDLLQLTGWPAPDPVPREIAIATVLGDPTGPSLRRALESARRAAQAVRPSLSIEVWEQINALYWRLSDAGWRGEPDAYLRQVEMGTQLVAGLVDDTMAHDEAWHFVKLGKHLERAASVVHLVARRSRELRALTGLDGDDPIAWAGMLRCCAALEAFRVRFGAASGPAATQFLLLDHLVPRSAAFCLAAALTALEGVGRGSGTNQPRRVLGLLAASFQHADPAEVGASPDALAARFEERWVDLHQALRVSYFRPGHLTLRLAGDEMSRHPQQQQQWRRGAGG